MCLCLILAPGRAAAAPESASFFFGRDFAGGAKDLFFAFYENEQVNYIYARTNGVYASMRHVFQLARPAAAPCSSISRPAMTIWCPTRKFSSC